MAEKEKSTFEIKRHKQTVARHPRGGLSPPRPPRRPLNKLYVGSAAMGQRYEGPAEASVTCCVTALYRLWKLIPVLVGSDEEEESIGCRREAAASPLYSIVRMQEERLLEP